MILVFLPKTICKDLKTKTEIKYTQEVRYQMLESYHKPDPIDAEVERLDKLIDQA